MSWVKLGDHSSDCDSGKHLHAGGSQTSDRRDSKPGTCPFEQCCVSRVHSLLQSMTVHIARAGVKAGSAHRCSVSAHNCQEAARPTIDAGTSDQPDLRSSRASRRSWGVRGLGKTCKSCPRAVVAGGRRRKPLTRHRLSHIHLSMLNDAFDRWLASYKSGRHRNPSSSFGLFDELR